MNIELKNVASVYSGKPGCACGCRGKYYYAKEFRAASSKERGYEVRDEEVNDSMVKKVVNLISRSVEEGLPLQYDDKEFKSIQIGCRVYTIYFTKEQK